MMQIVPQDFVMFQNFKQCSRMYCLS